MSKRKPAPECPDLFPHVAVLHAPGTALHGEVVMSPRVLTLLCAPSVPEFTAFWDEHGQAVNDGIKAGRMEIPAAWQRGARRRSNELQAIYNSTNAVDILRGLHRDHGVLPRGVDA